MVIFFQVFLCRYHDNMTRKLLICFYDKLAIFCLTSGLTYYFWLMDPYIFFVTIGRLLLQRINILWEEQIRSTEGCSKFRDLRESFFSTDRCYANGFKFRVINSQSIAKRSKVCTRFLLLRGGMAGVWVFRFIWKRDWSRWRMTNCVSNLHPH